jgi:2-polyprenyl-6-methoxyphenol hydroxylase-like FAD-dependent oxidoreductase
MNTGIQDATNVAWKFAAVVGGADESPLETHEAERRPVAEHVLAMSNERLASMMRNRVAPRKRGSTLA